MITWEKYNKDLYDLEQIILEYDFISEEERTKIRANIRNNRKIREQEADKNNQDTYIGEKIYNEVKDYLKSQKSCTIQTLSNKFKIGIATSEYIFDKLIKDNIVEKKFGTYWVIQNEKI